MSEATTDRELLELAAKAFWGNEIDDVCSIRWLDADQAIGFTHGDNQDHNGQDREFVWNPLADDGDALRLAVKLKLNVNGWGAGASATAFINNGVAVAEPHYGDDPERATRRAIVRAAAAIGRTM